MLGPSKEDLQKYWISNRQHFDALAKHYLENNRKYYDEYIAPFYNSPSEVSPAKTKNRAIIIIIVSMMFAVMSGAGMLAYFLIANHESMGDKKVIKIESSDTSDVKYNIDENVSESHYIQGLTYLSQKDYDKAEYHLKQVAKDDPDYKSAQQVLESIKYLKKYDKK
jgi:tetratricopeptide (TPR) repeat protein